MLYGLWDTTQKNRGMTYISGEGEKPETVILEARHVIIGWKAEDIGVPIYIQTNTNTN